MSRCPVMGTKLLSQPLVDEAAAAEKAGFDMIIANAKNIIPVREGSKNLFLTAALVLNEFVRRYHGVVYQRRNSNPQTAKWLWHVHDRLYLPRNQGIG